MASFSNEIKTKLTLDAGKAKSEFSDLIKRAKQLEDGFEDTGDAAKDLANAMRAMATRAEAELEQASQAADALASALGPEMAAKLGQSGVEELVMKFRSAGLTFDDVRREADDLADGVRRLGAVMETASASASKLDASAEEAEGGIRRVGEASDKTGSVMANTVGNASQELASAFGVAGVAGGTLGVTIGQLGEYAAEGGVSLKSLAKFAGPMVAVTAAVSAAAYALERAKRAEEFNSQRVEAYKDALIETKDAAQAMADVLTEAGKIEIQVFKGEGPKDITEDVAQAGLTIGQFADIASRGMPAIRAWGEAAQEAGINADTVNDVVLGLTMELNRLTDAQKGAALYTKVFGEETNAAADRYLALARAYQAGYDPSRKAADGIQDVGDEADDSTREIDEFRQGYDKLMDRFSDESATNAMVDSFDAVQDAAVEAFEAAKVGGDEAEAANKRLRDAVLNNKEAVATYLSEVLKVPPSVATDVIALLDEGKLEEAQGKLLELTAGRDVLITPKLTTDRLIVGIDTQGAKTGVKFGATGGIVTRPTLAVIGEAGPEAVVPLGNGGPLSGAPGASPLPTMSGGAATGAAPIVFNIQAGILATDIDRAVVEAIARARQKLGDSAVARALGTS